MNHLFEWLACLTALTLICILGSEGRYFPWLNLIALGLLGLGAWAVNREG